MAATGLKMDTRDRTEPMHSLTHLISDNTNTLNYYPIVIYGILIIFGLNCGQAGNENVKFAVNRQLYETRLDSARINRNFRLKIT